MLLLQEWGKPHTHSRTHPPCKADGNVAQHAIDDANLGAKAAAISGGAEGSNGGVKGSSSGQGGGGTVGALKGSHNTSTIAQPTCTSKRKGCTLDIPDTRCGSSRVGMSQSQHPAQAGGGWCHCCSQKGRCDTDVSQPRRCAHAQLAQCYCTSSSRQRCIGRFAACHMQQGRHPELRLYPW